ncbi:hypothetical protein HAQ00_09330 [Acidithiobacillus caldus ATCC 51756]|jgi:hypothetical protein|uniref:hypothetical protein n=1 Tax=Acidithiobacillus caldus TaxID=33059 RepID=UPI001C0689D1|nr:hypothetical protein [Acidithiobacillus caldus]MBU2735921.1 hypothetical protein [Acidithiobacillus caldus ATCC 51756]MBU2803157.1 hypothetical protein [Acidithiobacillus caldus]
MTNIAVLEGLVIPIGYSEKKKGLIFSVETSHGQVRCFLQGPEDIAVPETISIKGHIRSEEYDGEILEEVFVEMYSETTTKNPTAMVNASVGEAPQDGEWEDIPPALPSEEKI